MNANWGPTQVLRFGAVAVLIMIAAMSSTVADAKPWRAERAQAIGAVDNGAVAEREARRYLAAQLANIAPGTTLADFELVANHLDAGTAGQGVTAGSAQASDGALRTIAFQQRWRGLRVVGATMALVFGRGPDGDRLFAIKSRAAANVDPPIAARQRDLPRVEAWMKREVDKRVRARAIGELVVVQHAGGFAIAEVIDVQAVDSIDRWNVYVAADGTPLSREELVMDAPFTVTELRTAS
jgi:hypothetical protein